MIVPSHQHLMSRRNILLKNDPIYLLVEGHPRAALADLCCVVTQCHLPSPLPASALDDSGESWEGEGAEARVAR